MPPFFTSGCFAVGSTESTDTTHAVKGSVSFNDTIRHALIDPDNWVIRVDEPGPDNKPIITDHSIKDAINTIRGFCKQEGHPDPSDEDALADFIAVHWAELRPKSAP